MGQDFCKACALKPETETNILARPEDSFNVLPPVCSNIRPDKEGMSNGKVIVEENEKEHHLQGENQSINHEVISLKQEEKDVNAQNPLGIQIIEDKPDLQHFKDTQKENPDLKVDPELVKYQDYTSCRSSNDPLENKISSLKSRYVGGLTGPNGDIRNGFGILHWEDKTKYVGIFQNHKANGYGKLRHSDGFIYTGEFIDDKAHGFGLFHSVEGEDYIGYWTEDRQNGIGVESLANSHEYQGLFTNGMKNGNGTFLWQNGAKYEGEWRENAMAGWGIHLFADGNKYVGEWNDNIMEGYGEFYWSDGKIYAGYLKGDKKEGFGMLYFRETKIFMGFWKNNKQEGLGRVLKNSSVQYGQWVNGKRIRDFNTIDEALMALTPNQKSYRQMFLQENSVITSFFNRIKNDDYH